MNITIEQNIPIPIRNAGKKSPVRRALEALQPGESFLVEEFKAAMLARDAIPDLRPAKFTSRKIIGEGWRFWRVE